MSSIKKEAKRFTSNVKDNPLSAIATVVAPGIGAPLLAAGGDEAYREGGVPGVIDALTGDTFDFDGSGVIDTAEEIAAMQQAAADEAIGLQREQLGTVEEITQPFRDVATDQALPSLSALAFGGDTGYQQSPLAQRQLETGKRGIFRGQAAKSGLKSTGTFRKLSDLASQVSAEDVGRFEQGQTNLLNVGRRAEDVLRSTEGAVTGNVSNIFGNLGNQLSAAQQQAGLAQQAGYNTLGQGLSSLAYLNLLKGG